MTPVPTQDFPKHFEKVSVPMGCVYCDNEKLGSKDQGLLGVCDMSFGEFRGCGKQFCSKHGLISINKILSSDSTGKIKLQTQAKAKMSKDLPSTHLGDVKQQDITYCFQCKANVLTAQQNFKRSNKLNLFVLATGMALALCAIIFVGSKLNVKEEEIPRCSNTQFHLKSRDECVELSFIENGGLI